MSEIHSMMVGYTNGQIIEKFTAEQQWDIAGSKRTLFGFAGYAGYGGGSFCPAAGKQYMFVKSQPYASPIYCYNISSGLAFHAYDCGNYSNNIVVESTGGLLAFSAMGDLVRVEVGANGALPPVIVIPRAAFLQVLPGPDQLSYLATIRVSPSGDLFFLYGVGIGWPFPAHQTIFRFNKNGNGYSFDSLIISPEKSQSELFYATDFDVGSDGNLYVARLDLSNGYASSVSRFNGMTGEFIDTFVTADKLPTGVDRLLFDPAHELLYMKGAALVTSTYASGPLAGEVHHQFAVDYSGSAYFTFVTEIVKDPRPDYVKTAKPEYPVWVIRQLLLFWYKNPFRGNASNVADDLSAEAAIATWSNLSAHDRQLIIGSAIETLSGFVDDKNTAQEVQKILSSHFGKALQQRTTD